MKMLYHRVTELTEKVEIIENSILIFSLFQHNLSDLSESVVIYATKL